LDLRERPDQRRFRADLRAWLGEHVPRSPLPPLSTVDGVRAHVAWERRLTAAGYTGVHWPLEYGGQGKDAVTSAIFEEEYARAGAPERANVVGLRLVGPALMAYGTDPQRHRHLPAILGCDELWSQGFSEPEAGSDLAAVRTRASRDGDHLVVTGEKIWTTLGVHADWILALVRTGSGERRHDGLTLLLVDMRTEGVERRPIVQVNADAGFAQITFNEVRVPEDQVVGSVGQGWTVAMHVLTVERGAGTVSHAWLEQDLRATIALARERGRLEEPLVRRELALLRVQVQRYRFSNLRALCLTDHGIDPGPEASINKLLWSETRKRIYRLGAELRGEDGLLDAQGPEDSEWQRQYWYSRAATIYGGSSQIQKNIIAERLLGLPR
jgi:alkylation response protein AidB-like acyl-CoA dehydrogenase